MGSETILENFEDLEELGPDKASEIIETTKEEVFNLLKETLRPEFLNRIDEQIMFTPLSRTDIQQILKLLLKKVDRMLGRQGIVLRISDAAMSHLANMGYDPQFGARPMKRVLQREVVDELSKTVISGGFTAGDTIYGDVQKGGILSFSKTPFKGQSAIEPEPETDKKKAKPSKENAADAATAQRLKDIQELQKATKDVMDAAKDTGAID